MWHKLQSCSGQLCQHRGGLASPLKCPAKLRAIASVHVRLTDMALQERMQRQGFSTLDSSVVWPAALLVQSALSHKSRHTNPTNCSGGIGPPPCLTVRSRPSVEADMQQEHHSDNFFTPFTFLAAETKPKQLSTSMYQSMNIWLQDFKYMSTSWWCWAIRKSLWVAFSN